MRSPTLGRRRLLTKCRLARTTAQKFINSWPPFRWWNHSFGCTCTVYTAPKCYCMNLKPSSMLANIGCTCPDYKKVKMHDVKKCFCHFNYVHVLQLFHYVRRSIQRISEQRNLNRLNHCQSTVFVFQRQQLGSLIRPSTMGWSPWIPATILHSYEAWKSKFL